VEAWIEFLSFNRLNSEWRFEFAGQDMQKVRKQKTPAEGEVTGVFMGGEEGHLFQADSCRLF